MARPTIVLPINARVPFDRSGNTPQGGEQTVISVPSGLRNGGRITEITIPANTWVALPASPLADRNAINIQNPSNKDMKVNFTNAVGYVGMVIPANSERQYAITDEVIIYGRIEPNTSETVYIEELS